MIPQLGRRSEYDSLHGAAIPIVHIWNRIYVIAGASGIFLDSFTIKRETKRKESTTLHKDIKNLKYVKDLVSHCYCIE